MEGRPRGRSADLLPLSRPPSPRSRSLLAVAIAGFTPGALLGALFTALLFFLNPRLPLTPATLGRGLAVYASLWGLGSLLATLPFVLRRPASVLLRWLPWGLTLALASGAVLFWLHPSFYAYSLPSGINERMIKAAIWLTFAALVAFYTALLHTVADRPYGRRSRLAYLLLALLSLGVVIERRAAYRDTDPMPAGLDPRARPPVIDPASRPRLLVVGLDSATFDAILPLAEQGVLPFFAGLIEGGAHGRLGSFTPNRDGPLWTTLATGKYPFEHGIVGSRIYPVPALGPAMQLELVPAPAQLRAPLTLSREGRATDTRDREALPLWELQQRLGMAAGVIGWPVSSPAAAQQRFVVSDRFFSTPSVPAYATPPEVQARARLFRVTTDELDDELMAPFGDPAPQVLEEALAGDQWRRSLAAFLLADEPDLAATFIALPGLRRISRAFFGGYGAVRFEGLQRSPYQEAAELVEAYYVYLDQALSALWRRQPQPAILAVVSPYGAEPAAGWRRLRAELSERRSLEGSFHRSPDGVLLLYGPEIAAGERIDGAELVDVVPTLLYALGLPIARDLDGRVLRQAFEPALLERRPLVFVPTYETLAERDR